MLRPKKKIEIKKTIGYLFGLAVLAVLIYIGGAKSLKATFRPHLGHLLFVFFSMLSVFIVGSLRWGFIVNSIKRKKVCSYFDYFLYFTSGRFFGQYVSVAVGDFFLRPAALKKIQGINLKVGIATALLDKMLDMLFVLILVVPSFLYLFAVLSRLQTLVLIAILFGILFALLLLKAEIFATGLKRSLLPLVKRLRTLRAFRTVIKDEHIEILANLESLNIFKKETLLTLVVITIVKYIFLILRVYFLTAALGLGIPLFVLCTGIPVAQLGLTLAFTPGALGVLEGGWYAVLTLSRISKVDIATFLIAQRAYWFVFTGLIFLGIYIVTGLRRMRTDALKNKRGV
jgi:uncharacterized protein (TIRG00374 family)